MGKIGEEDVQDVVDPNKPKVDVETPEGKVDDKDKNLAALRKSKDFLEKEKGFLEKENEELKVKLGLKEKSERNLEEDEEEDGDDSEEDEESSKTLEVVFKRDLKEATRLWNKKNQVSEDQWKEMKSKVSLNGDETVSEIQDKIDEAYQSLPSVKQKREKELIEKGRKQAMSELTDDELDLGEGGDVDSGGGANNVQLNSADKKFLSNFGVKPEEYKEINKDGNPSQWKNGKSPTRKFFIS